MTSDLSRNESKGKSQQSKQLKFLGQSQIKMIDEALEAVGPFGEVQLIVEKGRLRFVVTKNSHDALKWDPDSIGGSDTDGSPSGKSSDKAG